MTSAHIVTLGDVPGEASDTDAREQLFVDDRVSPILIRNRLGVKPSVTQAHDQVHGFAVNGRARRCRAKGLPLFSKPRRLGQRSADCVGPTDTIFDVGPFLLALPMMVAVKQPVTIVFHTPR